MLSSAYILMTECNFSTFFRCFRIAMWLDDLIPMTEKSPNIHNFEMAKSYTAVVDHVSSIHIFSAFSVMHTHANDFLILKYMSWGLSLLLLFLFVVGLLLLLFICFQVALYFKNAKYPSLRWMCDRFTKWRRDTKSCTKKLYAYRHQAHFRKSWNTLKVDICHKMSNSITINIIYYGISNVGSSIHTFVRRCLSRTSSFIVCACVYPYAEIYEWPAQNETRRKFLKDVSFSFFILSTDVWVVHLKI